MANQNDHHKEHDQERPFLASTEAHQATLMKEVKKGHQPEKNADDPAPMLPPIVDQLLDNNPSNSTSEQNDASIPVPTSEVPEQPATHHFQDDLESNSKQAEAHEDSLLQISNFYPSSRRVIVGAVASLLALAGFSAVWFNANQDVYTLGETEELARSTTSQFSNTPKQSNTSKPSTLGAETKSSTALTISFKNLPKLSQGSYHLWLKQAAETTPLGSFTMNDQGSAVKTDNQEFKPKIKGNPTEATLFVSIESSENPEQPSSTIILSGEYRNSKATLSFNAIDLSEANGVYTIAAPTDLSGEHQLSGFWLAKTDGQNLTAAGLAVPTAPNGWKYEAQLSYKDEIIAAGRFSNPNDRDDFGVFTPNPDQTPNFPGEDYLQGAPSRLGLDFPANITSGEWKIIISIEPDQNGADPTGDSIFFLQPFTASIASGTESFKELPLTLDLSKFPTASVTTN